MADSDGYNTTIVLDCGDRFRLNLNPPGAGWEVGYWTSCPGHSAVIGYDPATGEPDHDRDRRVTEVLPDA